MKKLSSDLKRMLTALAHEDAGENLSRRSKMALLDSGHSTTHTPVYSSIKAEQTRKHQPQVAVIFDGHASEAVINYLLTSPYIFNAEIRILAHGQDAMLEQKTTALSQRLKNAGRKNTITYLVQDMADAFQEFCNDNPDLQFLISPKDDFLAKEIIENDAFHNHSNKIPLILIQDNDRKSTGMVSAA